ncbi:response regulator [uncultured Arcobacter sp.]|uniref:response regulator n=1 Tax=uncultured Arcobacter sp. TaxID=165434 RepID=UPI00261C1F71|nr:response regulator [uncultured Arcobacter sp.]
MQEISQNIKNLKILYVEDDPEVRQRLENLLKKISDFVEVAQDGEEAFLKIQENFENETPYELIITDLNMPKLNGIDMVKKVKLLDDDIPIILTTADNEKETFLESIELGVSAYIVKPINVAKLFENIKKIAQKIYYKNQFYKKQKELETYTNIIESVAVISKTDLNGIITYVDDAFCEVSGYTKEELIGQNHNIVRHPENPKEVYKNLWDTIQSGQNWEGKVRNIDKQGNPWYAKSTIFPIFDDKNENIIEYIAIRFIITDEYEEKRELASRLIKNTVTHKSTVKDNETLKNQLISQNEIITSLKEKIEKISIQKQKLLSQLNEYEDNIIYKSGDKMEILKKKSEEIALKNKIIEKQKNEKNKLLGKIEELEHILEIKENAVDTCRENITKYKIELGKLKRTKNDQEDKDEKKGFFG